MCLSNFNVLGFLFLRFFDVVPIHFGLYRGLCAAGWLRTGRLASKSWGIRDGTYIVCCRNAFLRVPQETRMHAPAAEADLTEADLTGQCCMSDKNGAPFDASEMAVKIIGMLIKHI